MKGKYKIILLFVAVSVLLTGCSYATNNTDDTVNYTTEATTRETTTQPLRLKDLTLTTSSKRNADEFDMGNGIKLKILSFSAYKSADGKDIDLTLDVECLSENNNEGYPYLGLKPIDIYDSYGTLMTDPNILYKFDYDKIKVLKVGDTTSVTDTIHLGLLYNDITPEEVSQIKIMENDFIY